MGIMINALNSIVTVHCAFNVLYVNHNFQTKINAKSINIKYINP